jgi:hypothetical protein
VLREEGGTVLCEDGGPVLREDGGPVLRGNFHGAQCIQDERGVSDDALGSGIGVDSSAIANWKNKQRGWLLITAFVSSNLIHCFICYSAA